MTTMDVPSYGPATMNVLSNGPAELPPVAVKDQPEEPPRRGPGRPRKDGTAPGTPRVRASARRGKKSLADDIGGLLVMSNFIFGFMPQPWNGDAFTEDEIIALSRALDAFAQDHATVYRYLSTVLVSGGTSTITLLLVVGQITQRRLDNHGVRITDLLGLTNRASVQNADQDEYATH